MYRLPLTVCLAAFCIVSVHAEDTVSPQIRIQKAAIGTAIDNREISGAGTDFASTIDRLYCWTHVVTDNAPVKIKHVWHVDGKQEASVSLSVENLISRTWSSKRVWPGAWKVDVTDQVGNILTSLEFVVQK